MPFFIGSVDLATSQVALYTTHALATRIDNENFKSAVLHLDSGQTRFDDDVIHQFIGPPILQWSAADCNDPTFQSLVYGVLKQWMIFEYINLKLRAIRTKQDVRWQTNQVPTAGGTSMMGHPSELNADLDALMPYLSKLALHFFSSPNEVSFEALGLYLLALWLKEKGVSESDVLVKMLEVTVTQRFEKFELKFQSSTSLTDEANTPRER